LISCPDCGLLEELPQLQLRSRAVCRLCQGNLELQDGRSVGAAMAVSLATYLALFPANLLPLVHLSIFGLQSQNTIASGINILWDHGWVLLAGLSAAMAIVFPFLRFGLLSIVLTALWFGYRPWWIGRGFRWAVQLDIWAMPDVFLLGAFIGYYRLINVEQMNVQIDPGGWCFIAAAFLAMLSRAVIDRRTVWRAITPEFERTEDEPVLSCTACDLVLPVSMEGEHCPRCHARLHTRKPDAMVRTIALLIAAFILFFPSNLIPMNISSQLGERVPYTIFDGVRALFGAGLWPLGIVIFCTSIVIPMAKILIGFWCSWSVWTGSDRNLVLKTKLFRATAELGRWSQTDPFVIVFFVPLMNFGALASATPSWGASAFMMMTFLTLLATESFDPRLMWDAAYAQESLTAGGSER
jgi:paraquat-inducible protein A